MAEKRFETSTVKANRTVVDDKLRPTAEIHILIGEPYVKDGEEHRYGHAALRVKTTKSDTTYDFGRYGSRSGIFEESGEGILRIWSDFNAYIKGENALNRTTTGFVYYVFDYQANAANDFFADKVKNGTPFPKKDREGVKSYKLAENYHVLGPNCTILTIDGARKAIKNIDQGSDAFNKPEEVLSLTERMALSVKGGAPRLFLPANLKKFLASEIAIKIDRTDEYGAKK